jgi:predicted alpha-1,2-mannosidase
MKKLNLIVNILISCFIYNLSFAQTADQRNNLAQFVDPFIGTGGHGHTYPGASVPFGMVQLSPDTRLTGWDGCSAYHHTDSVIYGFTHTHLSGTGCSDYGDILIMPTTGKIEFQNEKYSSAFKHSRENAVPGYYSVFLDKPQVMAELTATVHAGYHCYTFPQSENSNFIIDLKHRDKVLDSWIEFVGNDEIHGLRRSSAWAKDQYVYFVMKFSKPFINKGIANNDTIVKNVNKSEGKNIKAFVSFNTEKGEKIYVKVGLSAVSVEGAIINLKTEIPEGFDFQQIREKAKSSWNEELGKIIVEGGTKEQQTVFYTALYHCMLSPNNYTDVDGNFRGLDLKIHKASNFTNYTVFSIWDTYRALHPLFTIIDTKRTADYIKTFLEQFNATGMLPVWELSANETYCMIGYHAVSVIADAWIKGIRNFDGKKAMEAMKQTSVKDHFGIKEYRQYGFLPCDLGNESVSRTLEYSYDDWCIARMAQSLDLQNDFSQYLRSAQSYKNLFDPSTGFMRAKGNGMWYKPFYPAEVNNNYTEANSWQYSFYIPQDVSGYAKLLGGKEKLANKIDELFSASQKLEGREQSDITGLIGQYAHGNEPSHHMAYLYNYVNQPWKTQARVRQIMDQLYSVKDDGLCGNEDCGQMSAWLVMSAMGFYQVCPGNPQYEIGTPWFPKVTINLENGKKFTITAKNVSQNNFYIQSATLNGEIYNKCYIDHKSILNGDALTFEMGPKPNTAWGSKDEDVPVSSIKEDLILPVPFIDAESKIFKNSMIIKLNSITENSSIYYTLDASATTEKYILYEEPFIIDKTSTIKAFATHKDFGSSMAIQAKFIKYENDKTIKIKSVPGKEYTAGGPEALIDGIRGHSDFRLGGWQGYQGQDFEAVVDLQKIKPLHKISAGFYQETGAWILMPAFVEFWTSSDGIKFEKVAVVKNTVPDSDYDNVIKDFDAKVDLNCRYIKVFAKNYGKLPSWHLGAGGEAYIFIDEIVVE